MYRIIFSIFITLGLVACSPSIDPASQASLDRWMSGIQASDTSYSSQGLGITPPKVGQWAEYRNVDSEGTVSRRVQKVVGEEGGAYGVETEMETVWGTSVTKILLAMQDWSQPETREIRRVISQSPNQPAQGMPALLASTFAKPVISTIVATTQVADGPTSSITVPTGTFDTHQVTSDGISIPLIGDTFGTSWV